MNIYATRKLFDIVARHAMYVEQIKLAQTVEFNNVLREMDKEFRKLLAQLKYENLDSLSKAELNAFLRSVKESQTKVYTQYQKSIIDQLYKFMQINAKKTAVAYVSIKRFDFSDIENNNFSIPQFEEKKALSELVQISKEEKTNPFFGLAAITGTVAGSKLLWSKIVNSPLPSGGALALSYVAAALGSQVVNTENAIRKAYANKQTKADLAREVSNTLLPRFSNAMRAVTSTVTQHVSQVSSAAVASSIWGRYVWASVIDDVTSDICRERNGKDYEYGNGPLPPAHTHCRSSTVPFDYWDSSFKMPSFYDWVKLQPSAWIAAVFGATIAKRFADGTMTRAEFAKVRTSVPMNLTRFESVSLL